MSYPRESRKGARARLAALAMASMLASLLVPFGSGSASAAVPIATSVVHDPPVAPHALTVFPARDFVSADGQTPGDTVVFELTHSPERGGATIASQPLVVGGDGLAEVNHPGGTCWAEVTPNIVAGDTVKLIVISSRDGLRDGEADVTTVADVTATRPTNPSPGTIMFTGVARTADGAQLPADQLEGRLVAPGATFAASQRRDMRAPGTRGASISYDEPGSATNMSYTATWTGLSDADVQLALGAESMGIWLGRDPATGVEGTIYETGAGIANGPSAPCTAPKERLAPLPGQDAEAPSQPVGLTAVASELNTVTLTWDAATDNVGVTNYGIYRGGVAVFTVQNPSASAPAPTTFVDRNVPPGVHSYTVDAGDALDNRSAQSTAVTASAEPRPAPAVEVSNPPTHPFTIFPSRDMINVEGLVAGQYARVEVIRNGRVVSDSTGLLPDETGLVEINHVGAYCWAGTTPDIRANDQVRATVYNPDGSVAWTDEATTANVTAGLAHVENGVVTVHGTAVGHDGRPLPIDQIEQRMVSSSKAPFGINGKRTLRADSSSQGEGTLTYDPVSGRNPVGIKWTATYPGLDATDVELAQDVESRVMWLGRDPLAGLELTIFEVGLADPPGPAGPDCVAPLEPVDSSAPSIPTVTATALHASREVGLSWSRSTDDEYVYGYRIFQDGTQIVAVGSGDTTFTATGVQPGSHTFAVEAFDSASPLGAGASDPERIAAGLGQPYGNTSARSAAVGVSMNDVQAPSVPANLSVTNPTRTVTNADGTISEVATTNARLVFDPSTDDSGTVAKYRVYRNGVLLANAAPTVNANGKLVYTDTKLTPAATYTYAVDAVDAAGNASARTAAMPVTIALDNERPVFTGEPVATVPDIHGKEVVLTWEAATDNIGVTAYGIYRDGNRIDTVGAEVRTFRDVGLAAGTYKYKVDAVDSAGNRSDRGLQTVQVVAIANDPPAGGHSVLAYPARDFVEGDNYVGAGPVTVEVFRDGRVIGRAKATPDAAGLIEVNHAGPGCWGAVGFPNTPDIRAGDVVRITPDATGIPDQTTVAGIYVERPTQAAVDTVMVRGTATTPIGTPIALDQLEVRAISNGALFRLNGRNKLLAPGNGSLIGDGRGGFTATWTGLAAADVTRVLAGEMVVNWLGRTPLAGSELTLFENGPGTDGGPAAGVCTAPLDPAAPLASLSPAARVAFGSQNADPASTSAPRPVVLSNSGSSTLSLTRVYIGGANPGDFAVTPATLPATLAPGASVTVNVTFSPKAIGARSATLNFTTSAASTSYQTLDLTGEGVSATAPGAVIGLTRALANTTVASSVPVTLSWNTSTGRVTRYEVQKSLAGGAFVDVEHGPTPAVIDPATGVITQPAATSMTDSVATGTATRYRVRACNGGACSAYTTMNAFTLATFQENTGSVSFRGKWNRSTLAGAFGGSVSSTSVAGNSVTLKTNGTGFQIVSTRGPDRGIAEVWVDGTRVPGNVNLYSPTLTPAAVVFTRENLANTTHQVELRVLNTKSAASTGTRVDIDGFLAVR